MTITLQANDFTINALGGVLDSRNPSGTLPNQAPVWASIPTQTAQAGSTVALSSYASDPNGDSLTFQRVGGTAPAGVTIDPASALITIPAGTAAGTYTCIVRASDGSLTADRTFTITVTPASTGTWLQSAGLLWSNGIEPSGNEASLYPVQGGNRVWYVDANAATNGNGSSGSPYWSFTELNAGTAPGYAAGDHIYLTGDFTTAKNAAGREMALIMTSSSRVGSRSNPTVIRSWPGRSRAKFDGQYSVGSWNSADASPARIQVTIQGSGINSGLVLLNVEMTRCVPAGFWGYIGGEGAIGLLRVISCWAHHNYVPGSGPNSAYGGIVFQVRETGCDVEVRNCLVHDNRSPDGSTLVTNNNSGGIDFHTGPGDTNSVIKIRDNKIFNEYRATGNKWSGTTQVEMYQNHIYDCEIAHFIRNARDNYLHHELVERCNYYLYVDNENRSGQAGMLRTLRWNNITLDTVAREFWFNANGDTTAYSDVTTAHHNIVYNPTLTGSSLYFGPYGSSGFYTAGVDYYDNCILAANSAAMATLNSANYTRAAFESYVGGSNVYGNPLFANRAGGDFTLQAGSPALSINGQRAGAF